MVRALPGMLTMLREKQKEKEEESIARKRRWRRGRIRKRRRRRRALVGPGPVVEEGGGKRMSDRECGVRKEEECHAYVL